jgi:predicted AlkP superfamily phosphohydrolase/phosphomutase
MTKHFLAQEDWDFFAQVFTEGHCAGHQCWHLHDPHHPRHSEADRAITGDPVQDVYVAIDRAIGDILADVDARTTVVVMASHGMNARFTADFMLSEILVGLGVAVAEASSDGGATLWNVKRALDPLLTRSWQALPGVARAWLAPLRRRTRNWIGTPSPDRPLLLDPASGRCFTIPNNHTHGGIRVNLEGREPEGKVRPEELDSFLDRLGRDLLAIVNLETGKRIVSRVMRTGDYYRGSLTEHFPDLLVEWACADPVRSVYSEKLGQLDKEYRYCRTGDHNPAGMFIAYGPGIARGRLDRTVSILDFAPTFCEALGVEAEDLDGAAIREIAAAAAMRPD